VIVLDPGHEGKDPGAVSQNGLIKEKDLTLDIAMRIQAKIEGSCPDSTVVLTRNKDMF
jgi:N-acetylmuramoyl-L-alanine amidase